jgi:hypothetical protein
MSNDKKDTADLDVKESFESDKGLEKVLEVEPAAPLSPEDQKMHEFVGSLNKQLENIMTSEKDASVEVKNDSVSKTNLPSSPVEDDRDVESRMSVTSKAVVIQDSLSGLMDLIPNFTNFNTNKDSVVTSSAVTSSMFKKDVDEDSGVILFHVFEKSFMYSFFSALMQVRMMNIGLMKRICTHYENRDKEVYEVCMLGGTKICENLDDILSSQGKINKIPAFLISNNLSSISQSSPPSSQSSSNSNPFYDTIISMLIKPPHTSPFILITMIEFLCFLTLRYPEPLFRFMIRYHLNLKLATLLFHPCIPLRIAIIKLVGFYF